MVPSYSRDALIFCDTVTVLEHRNNSNSNILVQVFHESLLASDIFSWDGAPVANRMGSFAVP